MEQFQKLILHFKNMTKPFTIISFLSMFFYACDNQVTNKTDNSTKLRLVDTAKNQGLHGTWVRHNREGFTLIEINDTSNVLYYEFTDRKAEIDTITIDRYWYYKSKAKMGYWNSPDNPIKADVDIWVSTDSFRFDYKLKGDTLIEYDKMGEQGEFIKVRNDN